MLATRPRSRCVLDSSLAASALTAWKEGRVMPIANVLMTVAYEWTQSHNGTIVLTITGHGLAHLGTVAGASRSDAVLEPASLLHGLTCCSCSISFSFSYACVVSQGQVPIRLMQVRAQLHTVLDAMQVLSISTSHADLPYAGTISMRMCAPPTHRGSGGPHMHL